MHIGRSELLLRSTPTHKLTTTPYGHARNQPDAATECCMRNIQVIDDAENSVYDIFSATDDEFSLIFPDGKDIAFIDEVYSRGNSAELDCAFENIWKRRIAKRDAMGIRGILFYELENKKVYYPTRRDEDAINPNGSNLR
jgi:hypothetical protein